MSPEEALVQKIEYAFNGVDCLGGTTMADCIVADGYGSDVSKLTALGKEENRDWHKIKDEWIELFDSVFCFANDIGARFLIAPYMIWIISNGRRSSSCTMQFVIGYLNGIDTNLGFYEMLSNDQRAAIRDFLSYVNNQMKSHYASPEIVSACNKWKMRLTNR